MTPALGRRALGSRLGSCSGPHPPPRPGWLCRPPPRDLQVQGPVPPPHQGQVAVLALLLHRRVLGQVDQVGADGLRVGLHVDGLGEGWSRELARGAAPAPARATAAPQPPGSVPAPVPAEAPGRWRSGRCRTGAAGAGPGAATGSPAASLCPPSPPPSGAPSPPRPADCPPTAPGTSPANRRVCGPDTLPQSPRGRDWPGWQRHRVPSETPEPTRRPQLEPHLWKVVRHLARGRETATPSLSLSRELTSAPGEGSRASGTQGLPLPTSPPPPFRRETG